MAETRRDFIRTAIQAGVGASVLATPFRAHAQTKSAPLDQQPARHPIASIQDIETRAQRDARMAWWREARFGMFIHWGLYSVPAGFWNGKPVPRTGEWIMNTASIRVVQYKALAPQFNPTGFSAHDIVALAKSTGMRYIVITAKHHDGFAMFDSRVDPFNIVAATPFHRDPLRELAEECRRQDMKLGFYYSQAQDWTAPGGAARMRGNHDPVTGHWDKAQDGSFDDYLHKKSIPQIEELLRNYKEYPAVLWFDTPVEMTPDRAAEIVKLLNRYPQLIWNNRLGGEYRGDTGTAEQFIPASGDPGRDWEACMTINGTWGFKSDDIDFKSSETLLRDLIDIASKGGNYLLNIGPDSHGKVPSAEVDRLHAIGGWMAVNAEAIHGTQATIIGSDGAIFSATEKAKNGQPAYTPVWNWRSTTRQDAIYIQIFNWPQQGKLHLDNMPRKVSQAYLLADSAHTPLQFQQNGKSFDVHLPAKALDPVATVLVLKTHS